MNGHRSTWRRDLVAGHPRLFEEGRRDPDGLIAVGGGWRGIVGKMLSQMTDTLRPSLGSVVTIDGIESKNGSLRTHLSGLAVDDVIRLEIEEAADLAEARSSHTCEYCGAEGRLFETSRGWLVTACDFHGHGAAVIESHQHAGLLVRRVFDGKRLRIESCRKYIRSEDRVIDIDPASVGLEE
jgi:hypothetical protein